MARNRLGVLRYKTPVAQLQEQVQKRRRSGDDFDCFEVSGDGVAGKSVRPRTEYDLKVRAEAS